MEQSKIARPEYPRPDFQRERWMNLNGLWGFAFDDENIGEKQGWQNEEVPFARKIVVPFCYQSQASGIFEKELHENLWYRRVFDPVSYTHLPHRPGRQGNTDRFLLQRLDYAE